jgi:hypothetical protein
LTITTDITCGTPDSNFHSLTGFDQLRYISWTTDGIAALKTLGDILRQSASRLEEIKISCGSPFSHEATIRNGTNEFIQLVLKVEPGSHSELFPILQKLTLFGVPLRDGAEDVIFAFRLTQLKFLKLQDCLGTNEMLSLLATSTQRMHLTCFELGFTGYFIEQHDIAPPTQFLQSFQGLEDLFILYPKEWNPECAYWNAISQHHATVRRVVHQKAGIYGGLGEIDNTNSLIETLEQAEGIQCLGVSFWTDITVSIRLSRILFNIWPLLN